MINLLTPEEKVHLEADYRQRRRVVGGFLFLCLLVVAIVLAGLLIKNIKEREVAVTSGTKEAKVGSKDETDTSQALQETSTELATLKAAGARFSLIEEWQKVLALKPTGVRLTNWLWEAGKTAKNSASLTLTGEADSRDTLLAFVNKLREEKTFASVDSPISNLLKSRNASFSIKIMTK